MKDERDFGPIQSRQRRTSRVRLAVALGAQVLVVAAGVGLAAVPHEFVDGQTLTADQLNTNFDDLDTRIQQLQADLAAARVYVNPDTGEQFSLHASYCDSSLPTDGDLGGFTSAKALCETECSSPTAHMCTVQEMIRYYQTGGTVGAVGWVTHGWSQPDGWNFPGVADCLGWTNTAVLGHTWGGAGTQFYGDCAVNYPVHCCD